MLIDNPSLGPSVSRGLGFVNKKDFMVKQMNLSLKISSNCLANI